MQSTPSLCVALNGPPGIGKDTLASALVSLFHFDAVDAVANEIKRQAGDYFCIPDLITHFFILRNPFCIHSVIFLYIL